MTPFRAFRRWQIARAIRKGLRTEPYATFRGWSLERRRAQHAEDEACGPITSDAFAGLLGLMQGSPFGRVLSLAADRAAQRVCEKQPGRQHIPMPANPFGVPWEGPLPTGAKSAPWEDCHTFPPGEKPKRDSVFGLHGGAPISFVCVGCELEQPPVTHGSRVCSYCGLRFRVVGSRLFWWREEVDVPQWTPKP